MGLMILIDVAGVLRGLFVALTPQCLQIHKGWQVGGGASATTGFFIQTIKEVPRGALGEAKFVCSG